MKKLIGMFKSLPPEVRMMIALAGFGTPAAMVYGIKMFLFPDISYRLLILIIGGLMLLIAGGGFLVTKVFKRGGKKRSRRMESALAGEGDRGPVSMDVRAAIKSNNEKFFNAIKDMRKTVGISVYDLPWYIVIGDSGCGKTKLINEGGLTFSTGKPEGYQLGTLNYNWWFTEDAIFVDMAGRLCNPQDDADRKEWQAFLDTIAKGRRGFPINGALVCVSAEHLLADPPEKHEQDANTVLERLRDLQSRLGVTFATYLVITKCDKVPGFMQFFDRAERDITIKNQIFGWSKPGEFNELRDPEQFEHDFNTVYARLNDLRLRRLQDESDEIDLGLAYGFPEEFRQFRDPLKTYVRTLFPMIKNPRAIKNLIFRGVYFTSATQEGELILRHLTERLGADAADQFPRLDLYPNKRPHFIKDLLFRKVFPEHGLVFRNEQQAVRNRDYNRLFKVGSLALFVLLFGTLILSFFQFGKVIAKPRDHAVAARPEILQDEPKALQTTAELTTDIASLDDSMFWARILSFPVGARGPIRDLATIRAGVFEKYLLGSALNRVGAALRDSKPLEDVRKGQESRDAAERYLAALEQYLVWLSCSSETSPPASVSFDSFKTMYAVVHQAGSQPAEQESPFLDLAKEYFAHFKDLEPARNPARLLRQDALKAEETVRAAVDRFGNYLEAYARLDSGHPNKTLGEWMRLLQQCQAIEDGYDGMLKSGSQLQSSRMPKELEQAIGAFLGHFRPYGTGFESCGWKLPAGERETFVQIKPLRTLILEERKTWLAVEDRLEKASQSCSTASMPNVSSLVAGLSGRLDRTLWGVLKDKRLTREEYAAKWFEKDENFNNAVREVTDKEAYGHIVELKPGEGKTHDLIVPTVEANAVKSVIVPIGQRLEGVLAQLAGSGDQSTPAQWVQEVRELRAPKEDTLAKDQSLDPVDQAGRWRPAELEEFRKGYHDTIIRIRMTALLNGMRKRLSNPGDWGIAGMFPEEEQLAYSPSIYGVPRTAPTPEPPPVAAETPEPKELPTEPASEDEFSLVPPSESGRSPSPAPKPAPNVVPVVPVPTEALRGIHARLTRQFYLERMNECGQLMNALPKLDPARYFGDASTEPIHQQCRRLVAEAGRRYALAYTRAWAELYTGKRLQEPERILQAADWASLANVLKGSGGTKPGRVSVADELRPALSEVLSNVAYWDWRQRDAASAGGWYCARDMRNPIWAEIWHWYEEGLNESWASRWRFVKDAADGFQQTGASGGAPPWDVIVSELEKRWGDLSSGIEANADLSQGARGAITWGALDAWRQETRLESEQLTKQLVDLEARAQRLLSCELTNRVAAIQSRLGASGSDGLPYLSSGSLQTVDYTRFKEFLAEVQQARTLLDPLDKDLPASDQQKLDREAYYKACAKWDDFLKQADTGGGLVLNVNIETNPMGKCPRIQDGAQAYYQNIGLDLGSGEIKDIPTSKERAGPAGVQTNWKLGGVGTIRVLWKDGLPANNSPRPFPALTKDIVSSGSPLAFCAFLRSGTREEGGRYVQCVSLNLKTEFKDQPDLRINEQKPEIGLALVFTLGGRDLPEPIRPLPTLDCRSVAGR